MKSPTININKNYRPKAGVIFPNVATQPVRLPPDARLEEACGLARAINLDIVHTDIVNIKEIKPAAFLGYGYVEELGVILKEKDAELLIVDCSLTPIQQRNLEKKLQIKVIDRTALILEIFGERAQTKEGSLQVELAHLTYQRSRLVRSWTHLERQRGGAGFLGGPGETQIELDRRIIDNKIVKIKKELEKVKQTRSLQRKARKKIPYPVVALVGYTNAGKSTWFNLLTQADVFAQDLLFATLDPTMRKIKLPSGREVILSDTVGFISDLPHELIMSFRATLEEVLSADIIVHVRDIANDSTQEQKKDVLDVLHNLGLKDIEIQTEYLELLNKTDLLTEEENKNIVQICQKNPDLYIAASAATGKGKNNFLQLLDKKLSSGCLSKVLTIPASDGKILAWLHTNSNIVNQTLNGDKIQLDIKIHPDKWAQLEPKLKVLNS